MALVRHTAMSLRRPLLGLERWDASDILREGGRHRSGPARRREQPAPPQRRCALFSHGHESTTPRRHGTAAATRCRRHTSPFPSGSADLQPVEQPDRCRTIPSPPPRHAFITRINRHPASARSHWCRRCDRTREIGPRAQSPPACRGARAESSGRRNPPRRVRADRSCAFRPCA